MNSTFAPRDRRGEWILTFSGERFYPFSPAPEEVKTKDIAHALARASGRATVGVVAPEGQRCGQLHAGHLEPCPFDAFECDLPAVAVEGSQP